MRNAIDQYLGKILVVNSIFFIKIVVSICIILTLSYITERVSPKVAGILSGYPLGVAIALFFYGLEINPDFAARSAEFTSIGLVFTQSFA